MTTQAACHRGSCSNDGEMSTGGAAEDVAELIIQKSETMSVLYEYAIHFYVRND